MGAGGVKRLDFGSWVHRLRIEPVPVGLRDLAVYAALALPLALVPFALFHPGLWTNDSLSRWGDAYRIAQAPDLGRRLVTDWYPPLMTLIMAATLKLTGGVSAFTLLQYWFQVAAAMAGGHALGGGRRTGMAIGALTGFLPGVFDNAALVMPDPWTAAALAVSVAALVLAPQGGFATRTIFRVLLFAADLVLLGFRANSPPMLAVLLLLAVIVIAETTRRLWYCGLLAAAFAATLAVAHLPFVRHVDVLAPILLWETTCTLKVLNDPAATDQVQAALPQIGDMRAAVAMADFSAQDPLYWSKDHPFTTTVVMKHSEDVRAAWWAVVTAHPVAYLEAKLRIWGWLAGFHIIGRPFVFLTQGEAADPEVNALLGIPDGGDPERGLGTAGRLVERVSLHVPSPFYSPKWMVVLAALACFALSLRKGPAKIAALFCLGGALYYAAFFVVSPGFELRYFFPCHFLFALVIAAAAIGLAKDVAERLRFRIPAA